MEAKLQAKLELLKKTLGTPTTGTLEDARTTEREGECCICMETKDNLYTFQAHPNTNMCQECVGKHFEVRGGRQGHMLAVCPHGPECWSVRGAHYRVCDCCERSFRDSHLHCNSCPHGGFDICPQCADLIDGHQTLDRLRESTMKCPFCRQQMTIGEHGEIRCRSAAAASSSDSAAAALSSAPSSSDSDTAPSYSGSEAAPASPDSDAAPPSPPRLLQSYRAHGGI